MVDFMYFHKFPWSIMFFLSGKISSLGCNIEKLRCCCWNEYIKQCLIVYFFPIFESCSHYQNISILYYKKGQSSRNNFTYQKKKEKTKPKNSLCNNSELPFQGSLFLPSQNHHMQDVTRKHKDTFWPKQKQSPGVDVTGDRRKIQCCKSNIA